MKKNTVLENELIDGPVRNDYFKKHFETLLDEIYKNLDLNESYITHHLKVGNLASLSISDKPEDGLEMWASLSEMQKKKVSLKSILNLIRAIQLDTLTELFVVLEGETVAKGEGNWGFYIENKKGQPKYKIAPYEISNIFDGPVLLPPVTNVSSTKAA